MRRLVFLFALLLAVAVLPTNTMAEGWYYYTGTVPDAVFVQQDSTNCGPSVTSCVCDLSATTSGSLIVAVLQSGTSSTNITATSDASTPDSFTCVALNGGFQVACYAYNSRGGATTVTLSWDNAHGAGLVCGEWTGVMTASDPLRGSASATSSGVGTTYTSSTTAASSGDLLVGSAFNITSNVRTINPDAPWNLRVDYGNSGRGYREIISDILNSSVGDIALTGTRTSGDTVYSAILDFKRP